MKANCRSSSQFPSHLLVSGCVDSHFDSYPQYCFFHRWQSRNERLPQLVEQLFSTLLCGFGDIPVEVLKALTKVATVNAIRVPQCTYPFLIFIKVCLDCSTCRSCCSLSISTFLLESHNGQSTNMIPLIYPGLFSTYSQLVLSEISQCIKTRSLSQGIILSPPK